MPLSKDCLKVHKSRASPSIPRYWNLGFGREKGDVEKDEEAIQIMKTLGENMAWLLKKLKA